MKPSIYSFVLGACHLARTPHRITPVCCFKGTDNGRNRSDTHLVGDTRTAFNADSSHAYERVNERLTWERLFLRDSFWAFILSPLLSTIPLSCGIPDYYRFLLPLNSGPVLTQSITIRVLLSLWVLYEILLYDARGIFICRTFFLTLHTFFTDYRHVCSQTALEPPTHAIYELCIQTASYGQFSFFRKIPCPQHTTLHIILLTFSGQGITPDGDNTNMVEHFLCVPKNLIYNFWG